MIMFWFYSGYVKVPKEDGTYDEILVESKYKTKEEALEAFKDWPSGAPQLRH